MSLSSPETPILVFEVTSPDKWLQSIVQSVGGDLKGNQATFDNDQIVGDIGYIELEKGFYFTRVNIELRKPLIVRREGLPNNDFFILNLYRSNIRQTIDDDKRELGYNSPYGLFFSSTHVNATMEIPLNTPTSVLNITVSREWLTENILCDLEDAHFFRKAIDSNKTLLFYESNDLDYEFILNSLFKDDSILPSLKKLILKGKIIELLSTFLDRIIKRQEGVSATAQLHQDDKKALSDVRLAILKDLSQRPPSLDRLASTVAMSTSKLKRLFRQVYGESIYNYFLKARMHRAHQLLISGDYRVSEVAYLVGYTNLSQFSKIFKREIGCLPSELV